MWTNCGCDDVYIVDIVHPKDDPDRSPDEMPTSVFETGIENTTTTVGTIQTLFTKPSLITSRGSQYFRQSIVCSTHFRVPPITQRNRFKNLAFCGDFLFPIDIKTAATVFEEIAPRGRRKTFAAPRLGDQSL